MQAAADAIAGYVARGRVAFDADPAIVDAVLDELVVLGEASKAARQADPARAPRFPAVPWSSMARVRDRAAHHYRRTTMTSWTARRVGDVTDGRAGGLDGHRGRPAWPRAGRGLRCPARRQPERPDAE